MTLRRRAVLVRRRTELEELLDRHSTRGQAEFFLRSRGRSLDEVQRAHDCAHEALAAVAARLPEDWARTSGLAPEIVSVKPIGVVK